MNAEKPSSFKWPPSIDAAVLITIISVALITVKLMSVADDDPETALAILQAQGTGTVLVGALVTSIGLITAPICCVCLASLRRTTPVLRQIVVASAAILLATITIVTAPWVDLLAVTVAAAVFALALDYTVAWYGKTNMTKWRKTFTFRRTYLPALISMYSVFMVIVGFANGQPWMPYMDVSLHGHKAFTAWVLSQNNGELTVLDRKTSIVENFPSQEVVDIQECIPSNYWMRETLEEIALTTRAPHYPRCPI